MKQAEVLRGGPAGIDGKKAKDWKLTRLIWEAIDPNATPKLFKDVRAAGIGVATLRDPTWGFFTAAEVDAGKRSLLSPEDFAAQCDADLSDRGFGSTSGPDSCACVMDIEVHDPQYVIDAITAFRALRPKRTLVWTLESMQAGWFTPQLVGLINSDPNLIVSPQLYFGSPRMYPVSERLACDDLIIGKSVRRDRVKAFYDAEKTVPYGWDGILYGFNQLPPTPQIPL